MDGVLHAPDVEQLRSFRAGNEDALAAIYRSEYDGLVTLARRELGDELSHHAPRIAQQSMLDAWQARDRFDTPAGITAYLEQAVHECVAVQRRKHAALHRRGDNGPKKHGPEPTTDEAVAQLIASLHTTGKSHEELLAEAKAAKKQHAAEHVQAVGKGRSWKGPAMLIGGLAVVAVAALWLVDNRSEDVAVDKALRAEDARSISSQRGQRGTVTLNDDTQARMGAETRIRMPRDFGGSMRTLELTGVAHFQVAPGKTLPFKVRAGNAVITATGTAFAVSSWEGDSTVIVSVTEGEVTVAIKGEDVSQKVSAGQAVKVAGETISPLDAGASDVATAWMRDSLVLVDISVKDALAQLRRWYDAGASLSADSLGNRRVSLRLALQSSGDAIKALADSAHMQIGFDKDEKVVLSDAPPAPPAPTRRR